jgi:hypothetical protein
MADRQARSCFSINLAEHALSMSRYYPRAWGEDRVMSRYRQVIFISSILSADYPSVVKMRLSPYATIRSAFTIAAPESARLGELLECGKGQERRE